jgi:hypothetical protein
VGIRRNDRINRAYPHGMLDLYYFIAVIYNPQQHVWYSYNNDNIFVQLIGKVPIVFAWKILDISHITVLWLSLCLKGHPIFWCHVSIMLNDWSRCSSLIIIGDMSKLVGGSLLINMSRRGSKFFQSSMEIWWIFCTVRSAYMEALA